MSKAVASPKRKPWGYGNDLNYTLRSGEIIEHAHRGDLLEVITEMLTQIRTEVIDVLVWIDNVFMPQVKEMQQAAKSQNRRVVLVRACDSTPVDIYSMDRRRCKPKESTHES